MWVPRGRSLLMAGTQGVGRGVARERAEVTGRCGSMTPGEAVLITLSLWTSRGSRVAG